MARTSISAFFCGAIDAAMLLCRTPTTRVPGFAKVFEVFVVFCVSRPNPAPRLPSLPAVTGA
jgi:hypothetical protein